MPPNALPVPGDVVAGKYRIESVIGQGGMGVVLGATDTSLGRSVAIKFLAPSRAANEAAAARFGREARAAASIQSEHVVRVYEVGALENGAPFIVMEHLRGTDLAAVVAQRGGLPIDYACDLILQTCEALGEAHARGIVHRDLKPQNLFLTQRVDGAPCVKVLDFGISKAADGDSSPSLTSTDTVMGTPLYMSPEQVRSLKNVDARADIWALGAILHELLTASPPFDGPTASALHAAISVDPPPPLRSRRPDAPAALEAIVFRCLEKDPSRRFQNVAELADALTSYSTQLGRTSAGRVVRSLPSSGSVVVSLPSPPAAIGNASTMQAWQQTSPAPKSSSSLGIVLGIIGGVLLLLVGLGALGAFFLFRDRGSSTEAAPNVAVTVSAAVPPIPTPGTTASTATSTSPSASARPRPAGPAAPFHDAGAPDTVDQARAHLAQQRQPACEANQRSLNTAPDDANRKRIAASVKLLSCRGADSVNCERSTCRQACGISNDQACLKQVADEDRDFPSKY